uniref:Kinesin motor domain-containing protein n=1 Tax=Laticauda laticaudata TaxID=8630 RepID=A0A8C5SGR0_LATLA
PVDNRFESVWGTREKVVSFGFDYCYWSIDPEDPKYASQEMVFQDLGTMVCNIQDHHMKDFFKKIQVRDLLRQSNHKKPYTLRVREHPEMGPYVQGLSQHVVTDYRQIVELLEEGIANRITAATHIHDASSRSHAIFTIQYTQAILENNLPSETASKINLVDLAGSEKADPSYCKHRITEGANINKSLVTLGIVISTLAENTQMFSSCQSISSIASEVDSDRTDSYCGSNINSCKRQAYIPYRDSILTWLLKDSLGGNSKTIMVATISPASCCYNETVNTLRYASNAKKIINKPRVNEDANVKLIRELQEEIHRLKIMLMNFEMIDQLTKDWTDKWINRKAIMEVYSVDINKKKAGVTIDSNLPHFVAMDDDILSTGVVLYHLREGTTKIGRSDSNQDQDIVLQGQGIEKDHCIIDNQHGIVTLRPLQGAHCVVNHHEVTDSVHLSQGAVVVLGKTHKFRFNHPAEAALLRQKRSVSFDSNLTKKDRNMFLSLFKIFFKFSSNEQRDLPYEKCQPKLKNHEILQSREIQHQQKYIEELQQQIQDGQIKAEQELEHEQAVVDQQIRENQQWLIDEKKRLATQEQRESAVQTEVKSYAETGVQHESELKIGPSLTEQNKKKLVQLELLQKYSLKKAERHLSQKKLKLHLERIVKKQKLLEAKKNLEWLEATCWVSKNNVISLQFLNQDTSIKPLAYSPSTDSSHPSLGGFMLSWTTSNLSLYSVDKHSLEKDEFLRVASSARSLNNLNSHVSFCHGKRRWHSAEMLNDRISKTIPDPLISQQEGEDVEFSDTDSNYSVDSLSCSTSEVLIRQLRNRLEESAQMDTVELDGSESDDSQMSQDSLTEKENNAKGQYMNNSAEIHPEPVKLCKDENSQSLSQLTSTSTSGDLTINARSFSLDSLGDADEVSGHAEESKLDSYDEVPAEVFWKLQNRRSDSVVNDQQNKLELCSESSALSLNASSFYLDISSQFSSVCDQTSNKMKISFSGQGGSADQGSHIDGENLPVLTDTWLSNNLKNQKNRPIITVPSSQDHSEFWVAQMYPANKSSYWMKRDDVRQSAAELSFVTCYKKPHQIYHEPNKIEMLISSTTPSVPLPETRKHLEVEAPEDTSLFSFSSKNTSCSHISTIPTKPCYNEAVSLPAPNCQQPNSLSEVKSTCEWKETSSCLKPILESVFSPYSEISQDQDFKNNPLTSGPNASILQKEEIYINTNFEECLFRTIEKGDPNCDSDHNTKDSKIVELNHIDKVALHTSDQFAILMQTSEPEKDSMQDSRDVLRESALEVPSFREVEEVPRDGEWGSENKFEFQTKGLMNGSSSSLQVDYSEKNASQKAIPTFNAGNMMEKSSKGDKYNLNSASKPGTSLSVDFVMDKSVHSNVDGSEKKTNISLDHSCETSETFIPRFNSDMCYKSMPRSKDVCQMRSSFMENNRNPPDQKHREIADCLVCNSIQSGKKTNCCTPVIREQKEIPDLHYSFNKNDCLGAELHSTLSRNKPGNDSRKTLGEDGALLVTTSQNFCLYINKMSNNLKESVERRIPRMSEGNQAECSNTTINSEELSKLVISIHELECDMFEMKLNQNKHLHSYCTLEALESRQNSEASNLIQRLNSDNEKCCPNQTVIGAVEDEQKIQLTDSSEEDLCASELAMKCESNSHIPTINHNRVQENRKQNIFPEDIKESSKSTEEFSDTFDQLVKNDISTENIHGSEPLVTAVIMKYKQDTNLSYNKEDKNIYRNNEIFSKEILSEYSHAIQVNKIGNREINCSEEVDKEQREARKNEECARSKLTGLQLAENTALLQENQIPCFTNCGNGTKYDPVEIPEIYFTASKLEEQDDELDLPDMCINSIETHNEKGSGNLWNNVSEILKDNHDSANLEDNKGVAEWCRIKKELKQVSDVESINASQSSTDHSQNSISEHCDKYVGNSLDPYKSIPSCYLPKENEPVHLISSGQECISDVQSKTIKAQTIHSFKAEKEGEGFKGNHENPEQDILQDQVLPTIVYSYCCSDNDASLNEVSKQKELLPHMFSRNDTDTVDNLMPVNQRDAPENLNQDYVLTSVTVKGFSHDPTQSLLLQTEITHGGNGNSDVNTTNDFTLPLSNNVCNEVLLQYYDPQIKRNGKAEILSSVDKEAIAKSVDDLMLNKTLNYSVSEQSPNKQGTYSKFMECRKSLEYASVDNIQNSVFPYERLDSSISHNAGNFHEESEQLLNSFSIPPKESATLGLIISEKQFFTSVFKDELEEMTHSFQDSFENSISQKEVDSLVQYNQENKCLTSTCIENECKTNIKKCNEVGGCQTETTESPACRTSHAFSVEDNTVAFSEIAETLSGNSNKFIWENTHCMKDYGSECNVNSYMSGYSARHLNTLTADDLYFKESKFLNSEVSDLPVSSAEDYALSQQGSKIDGHGDHIEEIFENNKQGQNAFPECICDQENASLQSDNYTTRTETKLPEKNMLTPQHFNERSSHEAPPPKCSMENFSPCILLKNASSPKSQEGSSCSTCSSSTSLQHDSFLTSSLSDTFQLQENNSICHQDLPDSCSSSSETSLKSNTNLSETLIPSALHSAPLSCPSLTASRCEDSEILNPPLCTSERILFLEEGNELSSCQRNSISDCSGIHNFKSEKKCCKVSDCQEHLNIILPQKECLKDSEKTLQHSLNTDLALHGEQSTLYLNSNMDAINISTTERGNSHTTACKAMKAEREIFTSDQLNNSRKHDIIPSKYFSINDCSTLQEEPNAKRMKNDRQWPDLQTHSLSAPLIAMSVAECASETSEVEVESVHPASKSSQELNMSIEPPSPTEDDLCNTKSLSKLKTENVPINYKPRFQKKSIEAQGDDKEHISSSDSPPVLCLKAVAYSTDNLTDIETNKYSSSITPLHDYINKNKEPRYQLETTNEQDKDNNDSMHFNSSDINPYIHPWQQDECCKMGWKQYVFGSASDVSGNPPPLSLDNQTVIRCSSVDNGLNSQNSPFHSHLSSYANARMLSSTLSSTEDLQRWDVTRENMRCTQQSENTSTPVDEIVLFYPTKTNISYNKQQEILICDRETQTEAPAKHKRQKRHHRSYTDLPARKPEPNNSSFQEPSSWSSVQNISMHLSQLLHNTSELLGNLSFQKIKESEQNDHKAVEQRTSFGMFDRHTQTTEDIGIQTDILGHSRNTIEDRQINANMKTELVKSQEVNVIVKLVHPDTITLPKERTSKTKGRKLLSMPDLRSHDVDTQEHYYMPQSTLGIHSSSSSEVPKTPLTISSTPAFNSPKVYPTASPLYNSRLKSSATAVSNPASCISLSPNSYFQDRNPIGKTSISETRQLYCKNNLLVDRASSPILILSASPINQQPTPEISTSSSKAFAGKQVKSTENSGTGFKKKDPDLQYKRSSWESCLDTCSHTEMDSDSITPRESKDVHIRSGNGLDKSMTKVFSKKDTSKQKQRLTIDTHTAVHAERLYHSSSTLELSSHGEYIIDDHGETLPTEHSFHQIRRARNFLGGIKSGNSVKNSECSPSKRSLPKSLNEPHTTMCVKSEKTYECVPDSFQSCPQIWRNEKGGSFFRSEMSDLQDDDNDVDEEEEDDDNDTKTGSDIDSVCNTEILLKGNTSLVKAHRHRSYSLRDLPMHNKFSNWCGVKGVPHSSLTSLTLSAKIERLRRERAQVMSGIHLDMSQQPLTVELTEAKLTYGIGETDAQLRILQNVVGEELTAVPTKQQLYERHKKSIEILRKRREERLQCFRRSRSLSPQKHLNFLQMLDGNQREIDLPSRRREHLQQLRRDIVENTRVQEPKIRIQHPSEIEQLLREYQRAQEETKTEIARARDKLRERAEQEKKRIREQIYSQLQKASCILVCSNDLKNLYSGQATAGWKYQCTEKNVFVYYKTFPSSTTKHGFLGAGVINQPLSAVLCILKDVSKRHLYDKTITTAQVHKKIANNIELGEYVLHHSIYYSLQSIYEESMPRPCKEMVRGEILPSAWILQPDIVNGNDITKVIYMVQVGICRGKHGIIKTKLVSFL